MTSITCLYSTHRFRVASIAVLTFLAAAPASGQPAEAEALRLSLTVDDHRPLAALADELEKRFQVVLTYEDAPWVAAVDIEDVTQTIIDSRPGGAAPAGPVLVPRRAAVCFEYTLDPTKGQSTDYASLLSSLLLQYEAAAAPGRFRFEGGPRIYHLIPARVQNADGIWVDVSPIFSLPVSLADEERSVNDTLDEIVAQLNELSTGKVGWGYVPLNLFNQTRIRISADGVPARQVLRQILELLPRRITWRLNYDPRGMRFYLSFLLQPDER